MSSSYPPHSNGNSPQPQSRFRLPGRRMFDGCFGMVVAALIGLVGVIVLQSHGIQIGTRPNVTNIATDTSTIISTAPTLVATAPGGWDVLSQGGLPTSGASYSATLQAGQLLMLSGGQFQLGSQFCDGGGSTTHICALIYQATTTQTVTITALDKGNNWVGISNSLTPTQALQIQQPHFWTPENCQTGCTSGTLYSFIDGHFTGPQSLSPGD